MEKKENKRVCFESVTLFCELVSKSQLKNLIGVKSNPYPSYCFRATKKVMDIVSTFMLSHDMKFDRSTDDSWDDFESLVIHAETKPGTITTRNMQVVKRAVDEGYGKLLKRTFVDRYKKKVFIFYTDPRILEIKADEDAKSRERYEKRDNTAAVTAMEENKKKTDTQMSNLIMKAMEGKSNDK